MDFEDRIAVSDAGHDFCVVVGSAGVVTHCKFAR